MRNASRCRTRVRAAKCCFVGVVVVVVVVIVVVVRLCLTRTSWALTESSLTDLRATLSNKLLVKERKKESYMA